MAAAAATTAVATAIQTIREAAAANLKMIVASAVSGVVNSDIVAVPAPRNHQGLCPAPGFFKLAANLPV